jgi:hypothetical protein
MVYSEWSLINLVRIDSTFYSNVIFTFGAPTVFRIVGYIGNNVRL